MDMVHGDHGIISYSDCTDHPGWHLPRLWWLMLDHTHCRHHTEKWVEINDVDHVRLCSLYSSQRYADQSARQDTCVAH